MPPRFLLPLPAVSHLAAPAGSDAPSRSPEFHDDIIYPDAIPFVLVHLACLGAIWTGVSWAMVALALTLYVVRMFAVTAGYHRYFSHRSYRTSRGFQFVLAFLAQSSSQKSVIWWAALHRHHHKHSDTELDVHSPRQRGFWYSHMGWIFDRRYDTVDPNSVPDLAKYPELMFLSRFEQLPAIVLAVACWLAFGWEGLVVGFFWSTVLLYHGTFFINSLAHVHGTQRYATGDDSRNNWWLALITLGEGWHNNHHAYQRSVRQGFRWWEVDLTYYVLKGLEAVRLVHDMGQPPADVVANTRALGRATIERIAAQLAARVDREAIEAYLRALPQLPSGAQLRERLPHLPTTAQLRERLPHLPTKAELQARLPHLPSVAELQARLPHLPSRDEWQARLATLPHLPTTDELREAARTMIPDTPSMDDICERARELIAEARLYAAQRAAGLGGAEASPA
ncbi:MAG TPA: acyl-CoA desaturase [Gemmatimonadaceae bacterium]|nr:acyl-CoA desaturase [Gemmatimonadaceae bacterium]